MYAPTQHHLATAAAQQQQQQQQHHHQQQAAYYAAVAQQQQQQQHAYAAMMAFPSGTTPGRQQPQPFYSPVPSPQGPVFFMAAQPQQQQAPPPMQLSQQAPQPTAYFVNAAGANSNGAYVLVPASDFASLYQQQQQQQQYGSPFVVQSQQILTQRRAASDPSPQGPTSTTPPGAAAVYPAPPATTASLPVPLSASRLLHVGDTASSPSLGVSAAAPTVASSSSQSAYEDHVGGVDSVTLRSLERLMDEEEIAAAMQQLPTSVATTPARSALPSPAAALAPTVSPPAAPAAAEGKVTPPAEAVTTTAAWSDTNAVKSGVRGKKPSSTNSTSTPVDEVSSKPAHQAKSSAAPKTTFKALSSGSSTSALALPSLKFSSSRQKKGNRPTQVPPPAPGDSEKGPRQLIVNYLAPEVDSAGLEHLFAPYGDIEVARIVTDTATGLPSISPTFTSSTNPTSNRRSKRRRVSMSPFGVEDQTLEHGVLALLLFLSSLAASPSQLFTPS